MIFQVFFQSLNLTLPETQENVNRSNNRRDVK